MLVPMYLLAPRRDSHGEVLPAHPSVLDERDCDRQKELLAAGADPNELGRLGVRPLMNAAREGSAPCVQNLLASGARIEDADWNGDTALAQALTANREDTAAVLRTAGAKDFRITAETGRPIGEDSEPFGVVKEYIAAVHRGDFEAMARLVPGSSVKRMRERSDDLALWQSMRPKAPHLASGWMTDVAATLTVGGVTPQGERTVSYHLEKSPEGWRIGKEWFPDVR
jgi:ankyrin repeat protein